MKDRLVQLMESESLSPAKFADEIDVQRSSISHILSERNKPSYDFILKILGRFQDLNAEWLLTGKGSMKKTTDIPKGEIKQTSIFDINLNSGSKSVKNPQELTSENLHTAIKTHDEKIIESNKINSIKTDHNNKFTDVNNVKFIAFFYSDGTFERFTARE